jgi:hypothetical protein
MNLQNAAAKQIDSSSIKPEWSCRTQQHANRLLINQAKRQNVLEERSSKANRLLINKGKRQNDLARTQQQSKLIAHQLIKEAEWFSPLQQQRQGGW